MSNFFYIFAMFEHLAKLLKIEEVKALRARTMA